MARIVLTNVAVTFGTTDISSYVTSVTLGSTYDVVETTAFGNTARTRVAGLAEVHHLHTVSQRWFQSGHRLMEQLANLQLHLLLGLSVVQSQNPNITRGKRWMD